jgi:hypothetical protein
VLMTTSFFYILPLFFWLVLLIFLRGFKPYFYHTILWLKLRSSKYNLKVFLYGFYLLELMRWNYIKGYYQGYVKSPKFKKDEARKLKKVLDL